LERLDQPLKHACRNAILTVPFIAIFNQDRYVQVLFLRDTHQWS